MYLLRIKVNVMPEKLKEFESAMKDLMREQVPESVSPASLYRSTSVDNIFYYQEEWDSRAKLTKHMNTDQFRALLGCIKSLGELLESDIIHPGKTENIN